MEKKRQRNIKHTVICSCILSFVFLTFFLYSKSIQDRKEIEFLNSNIRILDMANTVYLRKNRLELENVLRVFAKKIEYEKLSDENYRKTLLEKWADIESYNANINLVYLGYDYGNVLVADWDKPKDYNVENRPWYIEGIKHKDVFWIDPYLEIKSKKIIGTVTKTITDKNGVIRGVFAFDINLNNISETLASLNIASNNETFLINNNGKVMAHSNINDLSDDLSKTELLKNIKESKKSYYIDENGDAYVFVKDESNGWILVTKIPRTKLAEFSMDKEFVKLILLVSLFLFSMYQLHAFMENRRNKRYLKVLKAVKNKGSLDEVTEKIRKNSGEALFYEEIKLLQDKIEDLEKELLRDEETGLYNEVYLKNYSKNFVRKGQKILIIKYMNLSEIRNQYGKNVVELVLRRGAMTINALKESEECALRLDKNTVALVMKNADAQKRAHYIIEEILNYKWKLHNINLNIFPSLLEFDEYIAESDGK